MRTINVSSALVDRLDAVLPQTQCRRCGYDGCRPYAEAIAGGAAINRCPPGGDELIATLAFITGRPVVALDRTCGEPGPLTAARIDLNTAFSVALPDKVRSTSFSARSSSSEPPFTADTNRATRGFSGVADGLPSIA